MSSSEPENQRGRKRDGAVLDQRRNHVGFEGLHAEIKQRDPDAHDRADGEAEQDGRNDRDERSEARDKGQNRRDEPQRARERHAENRQPNADKNADRWPWCPSCAISHHQSVKPSSLSTSLDAVAPRGREKIEHAGAIKFRVASQENADDDGEDQSAHAMHAEAGEFQDTLKIAFLRIAHRLLGRRKCRPGPRMLDLADQGIERLRYLDR